MPRVARPKGQAEWDGLNYMRRQGPFVPALVEHLKNAGDRYAVVIYVTALYYPIAVGILGVVMAPAQAAALLVIPNLVTNGWQIVTGPRLGPILRRLRPPP